MAIFGFQLVATMVTCLIGSRVLPYISPGRSWLTKKLYRYEEPSDKELKTFHRAPSYGSKAQKKKAKVESSNEFFIPKQSDITLKVHLIDDLQLMSLPYFDEFQRLIDYLTCVLGMFLANEVYSFLFPNNETNLSLVFCALGAMLCLKAMFTINRLYFRVSSGEGLVCVIFGFFFLLLAMIVLIIDNKYLEFDFSIGFDSFTNKTASVLAQTGINSEGPIHFITYKITLALVCAVMGAALVFSGIQCAKGYMNSLAHCQEYKFRQLMLHFNFIAPLFLILMWVRPVSKDLFLRTLGRKFPDPDSAYDTIRIACLLAFVIFRASLLRIHAQAHLNQGFLKVEKIKKEAGKISNKEYHTQVSGIYHYLMVVVLQYITPVLLIFMVTLLYKAGSHSSWTAGLFPDLQPTLSSYLSNSSTVNETGDVPTVNPLTQSLVSFLDSDMQEQSAKVISLFDEVKGILPPAFIRSLLGFALWWMIVCHFISSLAGLLLFSPSHSILG